MEAYSLDLRERVCAACDERLETRAEVAERFDVSRSFVQKLLRRRKSGSIEAKPKGRGRSAVICPGDRRLRELVNLKADATLAELCKSLGEAGGAKVSVPTMFRVVRRLGLRLKKRRCTPRNGIRHGSGHSGVTGRNALVK